MGNKSSETAITDFAHSIGMVVRRVRAAATPQEMSWTESAVLKRLAREGAATTAELARMQGMRPQSMRTVIASLEELGMIARRPHETDGRQVVIELTAKGASAEKDSGEAKRTWLAQAFARLDKQERETLFEAGRLMRRLVEGDQE